MNIGDKWNNWTVEDLLGSGSFGTVYRITRREFGHTYQSALKVIRIPQDPAEIYIVQNEGMCGGQIEEYFYSIVEQIVSEFALMSDLRGNSNIVSYEDHSVTPLNGAIGWEIAIRMELLTPLFDHIRSINFTVGDVLKMGIDLCKAIETCNAHNIIHRDIKPENIFVSRDGDYKLGDFGIARKMEETSSEMSKKGTVTYMAPEVYRGLPYDKSVDLYSLGIVMYRFLNDNRAPFLPPAPAKVTYSDRVKANNRRFDGEALPAPANASGKVRDIIYKACAYDAKDRYKSATEMREELESVYWQNMYFKPIMSWKDGYSGHSYLPSCDYPDISLNDSIREGSHEEPILASKLLSDVSTNNKTVALIPDNSDKLQEHEYTEATEPITTEHCVQYAEKAEIDSKQDILTREKNKSEIHKGAAVKIAAIITIAILMIIPFIYKYYHHPVPDIVGTDSDAARTAVEEAGLSYEETHEFSEEVERGKVISQTHEGESVRKGTAVEVVVSKGRAIKLEDLTGLSEEEAKNKLASQGLEYKVSDTQYSDTLKKGLVISQAPRAGSKCEEGDEISVVVSKGMTQVEVPDVTGKNVDDAVKTLKKSDLKVNINENYSNSVSPGIIISQDISAGRKVDKNSTVTINKSIGSKPVVRSKPTKKKKSNAKNKDNGTWE